MIRGAFKLLQLCKVVDGIEEWKGREEEEEEEEERQYIPVVDADRHQGSDDHSGIEPRHKTLRRSKSFKLSLSIASITL